MARGSKKPFKIAVIAHAGLFGYTYEVKVSVLTTDGIYRPYGSVLCNSQQQAMAVARGYAAKFKTEGY